MDTLFEAIMPFAVAIVTGQIKKLGLVVSSDSRKSITRLVVVVLSFGVAVGEAWLKGGEVSPVAAENLIRTLYIALGSTGIYHLAKR